jgi:hypothetical protein
MKTSAGDNLPIVNGMFAAGDIRAAENPSLTALHTLFVREHNYEVDLLHKEHPHWDGDHLYQEARAIVAAEIAHITYAEFLPHLLGADAIAPYHGYDSAVDPRITEEFAGAAYRFGHSIVSADTEKIDDNGQVVGTPQELHDVFFQPPAGFAADTGADGVLRHLASDPSQALDVHIVDDLRNLLVDPPDGQDLAAINIQRGRDLGLGTLNETREALGLAAYTDFSQVTSNAETAANLKTAFGSVDRIDLWTGGLAENHAAGAMVGETFQKIIAQQFTSLRDGDRLWYENQGFDEATLDRIQHTTLSDLIERNTATGFVQDDAFAFYERHSGTQAGVEASDPDNPQLVIGSRGRDELTGSTADDILVAAKGRQTMTGLGGDDGFVFTGRGIDARITDFQPGHDTLEFEEAGRLGFRDAHIRDDDGDTVIEVAGDRIVLAGIDPHQLGAQDFVFHA